MLAPLAAAAAWEALWWLRRRSLRGDVYQQALSHARALGRPLVVVGAPDGGVTAGYGCGDVTLDICESSCPVHLQLDVTQPLPLPDDCCVVFVSCVLEYVDNLCAAVSELMRISGGRVHCVRVEPWTLAAYLYPGAKRTLPPVLSNACEVR